MISRGSTRSAKVERVTGGNLRAAAPAIQPAQRLSQRQACLGAVPAPRHAFGHGLATANLHAEALEAQRPRAVGHGSPGRTESLRRRLLTEAIPRLVSPA